MHLSIGQVYAFSVFKTSLVDHFGTSQTPIAWIFSIAIVMLGLSAAVLAPGWSVRDRARRWSPPPCAGASASWSARSASGQLWLLYLGYGVIGGTGLGIGYISPVSTLIKCSRTAPASRPVWRSWASGAAR